MKLYELKRGSVFKVDLPEWEDLEITLDHLDGMYSYCIAHDENGEEIVVHVAASTPVKLVKEPDSDRS